MKHDDVFERIEPPPGGLAALRDRLGERPPLLRRAAPLAFAATAVLVLLLYLTRREAEPDLLATARSLGDAPEVTLGLAPMPSAPVAVALDERATTALAEVRTSNPSVSFYLVSSTNWRE